MENSKRERGFLDKFREKEEFNQYWYSARTIAKVVEEILAVGGAVAFLSTPSIYFSLPEQDRQRCFVFDIDDVWKSDRGFVYYDFHRPEDLSASLSQQFDLVVVDPPFITEEVWRKYALAVDRLRKPGTDEHGVPHGKVILTTVIENAALLNELFSATPTVFQPSIPHLVYQYNLFTNYPPKVLVERNPEIPE